MNRYRLYLVGVMLLTALLGLLGHRLFGAEPVKGAAKQLQIVQSPKSKAVQGLAPMPLDVELPPDTNRFTLKWVTFDHQSSTNQQSVSLSWFKHADPEVTGYKMFHGTGSRAYTNTADVGAATGGVITNLQEDVTYYFALKAYTATGVESDYSEEVSYTVEAGAADRPKNITMTLGKPLALLEAGVTNSLVSVGTEPGGIDWIFDAGKTNGFAVSNLLYDTDYFICIQTENSSGPSPVSREFRFPRPEPPLEVYVKTTLQYSNASTGLWEDRFSDTVTNPVGRQFRRMRIGGPANTPEAVTKAQQTAANALGPWFDMAGTVSVLVGDATNHPVPRFLIRSWHNQTNNFPYMIPEQ